MGIKDILQQQELDREFIDKLKDIQDLIISMDTRRILDSILNKNSLNEEDYENVWQNDELRHLLETRYVTCFGCSQEIDTGEYNPSNKDDYFCDSCSNRVLK